MDDAKTAAKCLELRSSHLVKCRSIFQTQMLHFQNVTSAQRLFETDSLSQARGSGPCSILPWKPAKHMGFPRFLLVFVILSTIDLVEVE